MRVSTVVLAFCSIVYELLLAQSLSTTLGNTVLRYNLTIGLYVASLGVGALLYRAFGDVSVKRLIKIEWLLACCGALGPLFIVVFDGLMHDLPQGIEYRDPAVQTGLWLVNHFLIVWIGFLSGFELPLLIDLARKIHQIKFSTILAADYLGTLIGAVLFPLWLLSTLGLFATAILVAMANTGVSLWLWRRYEPQLPLAFWWPGPLIFMVLLVLFYFQVELLDLVRYLYFPS
jgi:spermidine synthase